jgi:hypothetical protein
MTGAPGNLKSDRSDLTGFGVLLIEDDYFIADDLRIALQDCGAEIVGPVPSVDRALLLAENEQLACAVLNINLRGELPCHRESIAPLRRAALSHEDAQGE